MQRFSEGHIVAHLHIAEIECMPPDDGQARAHTTQDIAVRSPAPTHDTISSAVEAGHHLRVQIKSTGRTPSTTRLLETSSSESDLPEEPESLKPVESNEIRERGEVRLHADLRNQQGSTNCSSDVKTIGEEKLSNGCVQRGEALSRKELDSKQVNGGSNRSSNSADFLGKLDTLSLACSCGYRVEEGLVRSCKCTHFRTQ